MTFRRTLTALAVFLPLLLTVGRSVDIMQEMRFVELAPAGAPSA